MSLTYGFYNSVAHDRKYNAIQMSSIFDGIIKDGIFMSIGDRFEVTADGTDMFVAVGTGRAWFNHTWTLNDAPLPIELPPAELILNRYDAIVLEVNSEVSVRANEIKVVSGAPSSNPVYPTMINTLTVHQYPLAYIYVEKNATTIRQADITSMIGKDTAPYVTGLLETIDIESMVAQWEDQWKKFFETNEGQWDSWYDAYTREMDLTAENWKDLWHEWYHMYTDSSTEEFSKWKEEQKADFLAWYQELKDILSGQVETMLAEKITELEKKVEELEDFKQNLSDYHAVYEVIQDWEDDDILDSNGDPIIGQTVFITGGEVQDLIDSIPEIIIPEVKLFELYDREFGVEGRRNTFRGKNLGDYLTKEQAQNIVNGTFKGFFVGDYWEDSEDRIWRIVDIDYWLGTGDETCTQHHLVIMPDRSLFNHVINTSRTTAGGYAGSNLRENVVKAYDYIKNFIDIGNVMQFRQFLINAVTNGYPSGGAWYSSQVTIPNEIMMFGCHIYGPAVTNSIMPVRMFNTPGQLSLMQINPKWISPFGGDFWLRDVNSSGNFSRVMGNRHWAGTYYADESLGVRPVFGITGAETAAS